MQIEERKIMHFAREASEALVVRRSRKTLKNAAFVVKIGFDLAENEPRKGYTCADALVRKICFLHCTPLTKVHVYPEISQDQCVMHSGTVYS